MAKSLDEYILNKIAIRAPCLNC